MKCQILFSAKNKKSIASLLSAEFVQRVVKIKRNLHTFRGGICVKIVLPT